MGITPNLVAVYDLVAGTDGTLSLSSSNTSPAARWRTA